MKMICPACNSTHFAAAKIEGGLPAQRCAACDGVWVVLDDYRKWRRNNPAVAAPEGADPHFASVDGAVRLCATTGRMMARVKVRKENPLRLDYSAAAQAVWLDAGEWESLLTLGLHDQLDAIVSERWQAELKVAASRERLEAAMRQRFGDASYEELLRMRAWLGGHANRAEMIAFLNASAD